MHAKPHTSAALAALLAASLSGLTSCAPEEPAWIEDYLGPAPGAPGQAPRGAADGPTSRPAGPVATTRAAGAPATRPAWPLRLTVSEAVVMALENNAALRVERMNPVIRRTFEEQERAVFDPVLSAQLQRQRAKTRQPLGAGRATALSESTTGQVAVDQVLPTGTTVGLSADATAQDAAAGGKDLYGSRIALTATQALLRGAGLEVNLASLKQARLDTLSSKYQLRGFAESLAADTEEAYWDHVLARRQIEIYQSSLDLARKQYDDTKERVRIGKLAETEVAAAEAEVALRQEAMINAHSALSSARLRLIRLVNPPGAKAFETPLGLESLPQPGDQRIDEPGLHVQLAMRMRPELNEARLLIQRDELELVKTRNGLLPRLDLFITLGKSGYANSFGRSVRELDGPGYEVLAGLSAEFSPLNRDARARHRRANWTRRQAKQSLANLAQLVEMDVRGAHIELLRAREQTRATAATRKLQEVKLRVESEKLAIGKSTSLLVAQVQRDLLQSQIGEVEALVSYLKALVELRRLEGSLLEFRGIVSPGREPVAPPARP